jgi:cytochrome P450
MTDPKGPEMPHDGYDLHSETYVQNAHAVWKDIRSSGCPVAHSDLWGGSWLPTTYEDIHSVAQDPARFTSRAPEIAGQIPAMGAGLYLPPLTTDPPDHKIHRDLLEPYFTPARIVAIEPYARSKARELAEKLAENGGGDIGEDYSKPFVLSLLTRFLDVPDDRQDKFMDWAIRVLKYGPFDQELRKAAFDEAFSDLAQLLEERAENPGEDLVSHIARATIDGQPVSRKHKIGSLLLTILAGADTTWNALNASLNHLAEYPADRAKLTGEPGLLRTTAVEELLRVYAPLTIARVTTEDTCLRGRHIGAEERVILAYPAANRDPAVFENPDEVQLERKRNRHLTFGTGVHRCLGSHLARMEMRVAIEEWLKAIPNYERISGTVKWSAGNARGPENVRIRVL